MGFTFSNLISFKNNKHKNDNKYVTASSPKPIPADATDTINPPSAGQLIVYLDYSFE